MIKFRVHNGVTGQQDLFAAAGKNKARKAQGVPRKRMNFHARRKLPGRGLKIKNCAVQEYLCESAALFSQLCHILNGFCRHIQLRIRVFFRVKTVVRMKMRCKNDINTIPVKAAIALQPVFHLIHRQGWIDKDVDIPIPYQCRRCNHRMILCIGVLAPKLVA